MRQKSGPQTSAAEKTIKDIRRATRKHHSAEDKIRIVLEGLRGEESNEDKDQTRNYLNRTHHNPHHVCNMELTSGGGREVQAEISLPRSMVKAFLIGEGRFGVARHCRSRSRFTNTGDRVCREPEQRRNGADGDGSYERLLVPTAVSRGP